MIEWQPHSALHRTLLAVALAGLLIALTATAGALQLPAQASMPPQQVAALAVSVGEIDVSWSATLDQDIRGYAIFRNNTPLATVNAGIQSYIDVGVASSTVYSYTIATISLNDIPSLQSNPVVAKTPALPDTLDLTPPSPPQSLSATPQANAILLDWYDASDDTDLTVYRIRRDGLVVATVNAATLRYVDPSIQPLTAYTYTVEALDVMGHHSLPSNAVAVLTLGFTPPIGPYPPPDVSAVPEQDAIVLRWGDDTDDDHLSGYNIWRNGTTLAHVISETLSYSDTDVLPGTFYTYMIEAVDTVGNRSLPSASVTAMVPPEAARFLPLPR